MIKYLKALHAAIKGIRQGIKAGWTQSLEEHKERVRLLGKRQPITSQSKGDWCTALEVENHGSISSGGGGYMPEPEIDMVTVCENQIVVDHNGDFIGYGKEAFDKLGIKYEN